MTEPTRAEQVRAGATTAIETAVEDDQTESEATSPARQRREVLRRYRQQKREKALARPVESRMESVQRALTRAEGQARAAALLALDEREAAALRGKAKAYWEARTMIGMMLDRGYLPAFWKHRWKGPSHD